MDGETPDSRSNAKLTRTYGGTEPGAAKDSMG